MTPAEVFILGVGAKLFAIAEPEIVHSVSASGLNNHNILKVGRGLAPAAKQKGLNNLVKLSDRLFHMANNQTGFFREDDLSGSRD